MAQNSSEAEKAMTEKETEVFGIGAMQPVQDVTMEQYRRRMSPEDYITGWRLWVISIA
jgi:hypothetical protein